MSCTLNIDQNFDLPITYNSYRFLQKPQATTGVVDPSQSQGDSRPYKHHQNLKEKIKNNRELIIIFKEAITIVCGLRDQPTVTLFFFF